MNSQSNPYQGFVLPLNYQGTIFQIIHKILKKISYNLIIGDCSSTAERRPVKANVGGSNPLSHPFDKFRVNPYFMPIKPLEGKTDRSLLFKLSFLIALIVTGILLNKILLKKNKEIPSILGKTQEIKLQTQKKLVEKVQKSDFINDTIKKAEDVGGAILGEATDTITKLSSDAGSFISDIIYENSIGKIVEQVDKLPKDQQEKIKEQICK